MNILVVTQYFWPENFRINDLVRGLLERGHQVTVLTSIPNYPEGNFFQGYGLFKQWRQDYFGAKVYRVPLIPRGKGGAVRLVLNYASFALSASLFAPFFFRKKIDHIFVFAPSPITVAFPALVLQKLKSIPMTIWVQDLWPESLSATGFIKSARLLAVVAWFVRMIYKSCDRILITSKAYASSIEKLGVSLSKIVYFPQSAEELYRPVSSDTETAERKLMPNGFCVMFAGNIGTAQDFPTILAAAEILKSHQDVHWVIVGGGRMKPWVDAEVQKRGLSDTVHLLGRFPLETMPSFFALADVMLVTLKKDPLFALTIPAKIQSYLACGRPIIAALDGEGAAIVEEANAGISCSAENPQALARAVLQMYHESEDNRRTMGLQGRAFYLANFERNILIDRLALWMQASSKNM